ncbi:GNAT family N-acetyltransferase [Rossellomorea sp. SC111]|uniref:GNAT family N-acetyltransferase n=1 Tax=Rossellomorea sp. SC111 TaxID=2968985 RepID=UPI00215A6BDD|nr:GNAT family N-acetyltransferase [Rossellomorea sp. SC111]MCR8848467.1 GNAT family N-acetyltransferase [Rossellomorea sp. SC111]
MKEIKEIDHSSYESFCSLANGAFPGLNADQWLQGHIEETPSESLYGLFKGKDLVAGMRSFLFEMNLNQTTIPVGGVGMLAVDLLHKKEGNAYQLIKYFYELNTSKGHHLVMLYPFNVAFYKRMGFGMGTQVYQYYVSPSSFQNASSKEHLKQLSYEDRELILDCYNRVYQKTHGMTKRFPTERELNRPFNFGKVVGFKQDDQVLGYVLYEGKGKDLYIHELFFETREAIEELSTFLHQQADQFKRVIINSNQDDLIHFLSSPESGVDTMLDTAPSVDNKHIVNLGVGVMYRVIDCKGLLLELYEKKHRFGNTSITVGFEIQDDLQDDESKNFTVTFSNGEIQHFHEQSVDTVVQMDISEFSSMIMGAVTFRSLYKWGKADISNPACVNQVNDLFHTSERPVCTKAF